MSASPDTKSYQPQIPPEMSTLSPTELTTFADTNSERRIVTILFCDVAGSTAMAEVLDPEEWADVMLEAFTYLIQPIERYGGTVTRLMGDSVLALFGAPRAHENDPQRAILAAIEITENIQPLRDRVKAEYGLDFNVRVGINTGLVVVGAFGSTDMHEYTAMGDPINVAARLQQITKPGTIHVGESTYLLTAPLFEFEPLGYTQVRGKREPEKTYLVIGKKRPTDRVWDVEGRDMPFTGRDEEFARVKQAIDELRFEGRGRIISIMGEAGIGKTRFVEEIENYISSLPPDDGGMSIALLTNRINPYDRDRPYASLQARFRKVFGIEQGDSPQVVREKFIERSKQFPAEFRERGARAVQRVMALDIDGENGASFQADEFKSELSSVVTQIVRGWNPDGAFVLIGEDYHWGDLASLEILSHLYTLLGERPVMFICTFRPELDSPVMQMLRSVTEQYSEYILPITLTPLSSNESRSLVETLIVGDTPTAELVRDIVRSRSEGNPLFVEEIIHALADQGILERVNESLAQWTPAREVNLLNVSVPTSLQALLLERIDRLPPDARRTLQQASVLGRSFSKSVLRGIAQINGNLENHLAVLRELDIIRSEENGDGDQLTFRHALIQEAAYSTILHRHRREFHRRAAETIEHVFAERVLEHADEIGEHYYQARDGRGVPFLVRAAEQARLVFEPTSVITYATRAIDLANMVGLKVPATAYQLRGNAYDMTGNFDDARRDLQTALDISQANGDRDFEWRAVLDLGVVWMESDYSKAGEFLSQALQLARDLGDDSKVAHSLNRVGNWRINVGDPVGARESHQEALVIFERLKDQQGLAETLDLLGLASYLTADFRESVKSFRQAIEIFRERGDERGLSSSLAMLALSGGSFDSEVALLPEGQYEQWLEAGREAVEIAQKIGWRSGEAFALIVTGVVHAVHGQPSVALSMVCQGEAIAREIGHRQWSLAATHQLGVIALSHYHYEKADAYLTSALKSARDLGSAYWTRSAASYLADLYLELNKFDDVEILLREVMNVDSTMDALGQRKVWFRKARLELARGNPTIALNIADRLIATSPGWQPGDVIPGIALLRGQALAALGQFEAAVSELQSACVTAESIHDLATHLRLRGALVNVYRQLGDESKASEERQNVTSIRERAAASLPDDEWRTTFLERTAHFITD